LSKREHDIDALSAKPKSRTVTYVLAAMCVVGFGVQLAMGADAFKMDPDKLILCGANFGPSTITKAQYWRLLTSIFLHGEIIHLVLNLASLIGFGPLVETALGRFRFIYVFFLSGIVGGLSTILTNPVVTSVGCSGAVLGVIGAYMVASWTKQIDATVRLTRPQLIMLSVFLLYSTLLGFTSNVIDNTAHLAGFATGAIAALFLTPRPHGRANLFNSMPAKALAMSALIPVLIALGMQRVNNNDDVKCYLERREAIALLKEKKFLHGLEKLDKALSYRPDDTSILADRARALVELEKYDKALADVSRCIQLKPKDPNYWSMRASIHHKAGQTDEAIVDMTEAIRLRPSSGELLNNLAWFQLAAGKPKRALENCNVAISRDSHQAATYDTRAVALTMLGRYEEADVDAARAAKMEKTQGAHFYHRSIILMALGRDNDARVAFARYRELDYKPEAWEPKNPLMTKEK
jgi:membrane associated rhomboid family serine protease/Flp pilus assembly protein TadD